MTATDYKVGDKVYFGRPNGQKTLAEVVKLNPTKAKVRTLEGRGSRDQAGVVWSVPYSLLRPSTAEQVECSHTGGEPEPLEYSPFAGAVENALLEALAAVYLDLSPENLSCDGEARPSAVRARGAKLNRQRHLIVQALGRDYTEEQVYDWLDQKRAYHKNKGN